MKCTRLRCQLTPARISARARRSRSRLFDLPPRSPRLNGHVERAHRTHQEEFYDLVEVPEDLALHNTLLREYEAVYNGLGPHQALGYLTPNEFLARCQADHR